MSSLTRFIIIEIFRKRISSTPTEEVSNNFEGSYTIFTRSKIKIMMRKENEIEPLN